MPRLRSARTAASLLVLLLAPVAAGAASAKDDPEDPALADGLQWSLETIGATLEKKGTEGGAR